MRAPSKRAAAKALGVALSSLQEAIASGRLTWPPADLEAARAQWIASSNAQGPAPLVDRDAEPLGAAPLAASRARKEAALAGLRELELARERAELVPARDVERRLVDVFSAIKTHLLGVPVRVRQTRPNLDLADVAAIERAVREALEELADGRVRGV